MLNAFEIVGAQSDVGAHLRRAGIAGGDKKLLDFWDFGRFSKPVRVRDRRIQAEEGS